MAFVDTERRGQVLVVRMNRPERLNALGQDLRTGLAEAWCEFRDSDELEVGQYSRGRGAPSVLARTCRSRSSVGPQAGANRPSSILL
jgi:hypothetical protein